jgi:2-polyprenyl-6-methoxyphenol hydroxylase-like FAD-dependent oxidoreductase
MNAISSAIVAGAGIGGAAAALALARSGVRTTVLERVSDPRDVGAALLLQPNGLGVLDGLGLGHAVRADAFRTSRGVPLRDERGRLLAEAPLPSFGEGLDEVAVLRRSVLLGVLHEALAAEPRVDLRLGTTVDEAAADGSVRARTADGPVDLSADLVVAADGVNSRVRESAGLPARVRRTGIRYLRALAPVEPPEDAMGETWTPLGIFGIAPVPGGTYLYASCSAPPLVRAIEARDLAGLRAAWAGVLPATEPLFGALASWEDLIMSDVTEVRSRCFVQGRVALLGDAAHAMAPNLGQGANSALVDAAVLVAELTSASDRDVALRAYDARRRPAVTGVQRRAHTLMRAADVRHPVGRRLRDSALRVADRLLPTDRAARAMQQEEPAWLRDVTAASAY